jgi:hypothetical protein
MVSVKTVLVGVTVLLAVANSTVPATAKAAIIKFNLLIFYFFSD